MSRDLDTEVGFMETSLPLNNTVNVVFAAIVGFKCPEKVPAHSVSAKFLPYPRYPVPGDCSRLITCVNGFPRLITCEHGKLLDESSLTCEDQELVPKW